MASKKEQCCRYNLYCNYIQPVYQVIMQISKNDKIKLKYIGSTPADSIDNLMSA